MRLIGLLFTFLLVFVPSCVPASLPQANPTTMPVPTQTILAPTITAAITLTVPTHTPSAPTGTPSAPAVLTPTELPYTACGWVWATQDLPQVTALLKQDYQDAGMPEVEASASAYGENCLDQAGKVDHFAAMETDFNLIVPVKDTKDTQALGDWVVKLVPVIQKIPSDQLAGPNPGRISIRYKGDGDEVNLAFARARVEELLQQGLSGSALFDALKTNP